MFILPKFIFNDDASEAGSGSPAAAIEAPAKVESPNSTQPTPAFSTEELTEFGFDSPEALRAFITEQKAKNIPDAEKQKQEQLDKANLVKYAVENEKMKVEDFTTYENLKAKADRDLVYERFAAELKEDDPELSDEDIKEEFESEYKLADLNDKKKAKGLSRLQKEAAEIRTPYETKYNSALSEYTEAKELKAQYPKFSGFIDSLVGEAVKEKFTVLKVKEGEEEVPIDIDLTKEDREAIAKAFKNEKTFYAFFKGGEAGLGSLKEKITQKINGYIKTQKFDEAISKVHEVSKGIGVKAGSSVGAENPFALVKNQTAITEEVDASTKKAAEASRNRNR